MLDLARLDKTPEWRKPGGAERALTRWWLRTGDPALAVAIAYPKAPADPAGVTSISSVI